MNNNLSDPMVVRSPEFQVVIVIEYDDGRMFPITEDRPKCLLPIANKELLSYQLDILIASGVTEVIIACTSEYQNQLSYYVSKIVGTNIKIDLVFIQDMNGSVDALRGVTERIRGDFICISSDTLCQYPLGDLINVHRLSTSDLTFMLNVVNPLKDKIDEVDQEYIALSEKGRIVMKTPTLQLDETIQLSKSLLHYTGTGMSLRNDLVDLGIYVMSHWIIDLVVANKKFVSIRTDLVTYLIQRQFQSSSYLYKAMPALALRSRCLRSVDNWLVSDSMHSFKSKSIDHLLKNNELVDHLTYENDIVATSDENGLSIPDKPIPEPERTHNGVVEDLLRSFALVYDTTQLPATITSVMGRMITPQNYLTMNRDMPLSSVQPNMPWDRIAGYMKKELSTIAEGVDVSSKNITIKQCTVGNNSSIGSLSKLNNSVVLENVIIGENCTIQNCIISEGAIIESNCNLKDCYIGVKTRIQSGSKLKSECISDLNRSGL